MWAPSTIYREKGNMYGQGEIIDTHGKSLWEEHSKITPYLSYTKPGSLTRSCEVDLPLTAHSELIR